jgi:hypothetical protein
MQIIITGRTYECSLHNVQFEFEEWMERPHNRGASLCPHVIASLKGLDAHREEYPVELKIEPGELLKMVDVLDDVQSELYAYYGFLNKKNLWDEFLNARRVEEQERKAAQDKKQAEQATTAG